MWQEFKAFLIKQNALALAIGVVIGGALDSVVKGLVEGFIMPIVTLFLPKDAAWQTYTLPGPIGFKIGMIANALLNFAIIGFVAWRLSKLFLKEAPAAPPKAVKACPFCLMGDLDPAARRCPHCTSDLSGAGVPSLGSGGAAPARV